jgi:uncharacterized protein YigE (DUF2233 family)
MNCRIVYLIACLLIISACDRIDEATKKQLKKEGKKVAKQVAVAAQHFDGKHTFVAFEAKQNTQRIKMFWKDNNGNILGSLQNLKTYVESQGDTLLYACNGGMYMQNQSPLGWYIENGKERKPINTKAGKGNFYLNPKGIFYVQKNNLTKINSIQSENDRKKVPASTINYLTQSGPMLVHEGKINALFTPSSLNINIRNGVGILQNGNALFVMSTYPLCFYDFAKYFADKGCKEALYLDGFVSRTYYPEENYEQLDGGFGVMIGVVRKR